MWEPPASVAISLCALCVPSGKKFVSIRVHSWLIFLRLSRRSFGEGGCFLCLFVAHRNFNQMRI
jgi:hypothetical protein